MKSAKESAVAVNPSVVTLGDALDRICREHGCTELQVSAWVSQRISLTLPCVEPSVELEHSEKERVVPFAHVDKPAYQVAVTRTDNGQIIRLVAFVVEYTRHIVVERRSVPTRALYVHDSEREAQLGTRTRRPERFVPMTDQLLV